MPAPVSATSSTACEDVSRTRTVTSPASVYLNALETRFGTIFSHMSASIHTRSRKRRAVEIQPQPRLVECRLKHAGKVAHDRPQFEGRKTAGEAAGFQAREIQQRIDKLQRSERVVVRQAQPRCMREAERVQ